MWSCLYVFFPVFLFEISKGKFHASFVVSHLRLPFFPNEWKLMLSSSKGAGCRLFPRYETQADKPYKGRISLYRVTASISTFRNGKGASCIESHTLFESCPFDPYLPFSKGHYIVRGKGMKMSNSTGKPFTAFQFKVTDYQSCSVTPPRTHRVAWGMSHCTALFQSIFL